MVERTINTICVIKEVNGTPVNSTYYHACTQIGIEFERAPNEAIRTTLVKGAFIK